MNTRRQAQEYIQAFRKYIPGMENCILVSTGPKLGIRETRHIVGKYTLSLDEVLNAVKNERGIARGHGHVRIIKSLIKWLNIYG